MPKDTTGVEDKPLVFAVSICPNTAEPLMETLPLSTGNDAAVVLNVIGALDEEAKCVAVSAIRCVKL